MAHLKNGEARAAHEYRLKKSSVAGTTGYMKCVPVGIEDLGARIEELAKRPLDVFLHKHVLASLSQEHEEILATFLAQGGKVAAVCRVLLLEWRFLHGGEEQGFAGPEWQADASLAMLLSPLPLPLELGEALGKRKKLADLFRGNLEKGTLLPANLELDEEELAKVKACSQKLLAAGAESGKVLQSFPRGMKEAPPPPNSIWPRVEEILERTGLAAHPEMRHEESLSPIALLRDWPLENVANLASGKKILRGTLTAYGRGLSLGQARVSLRMEIVERASAFAGFSQEAAGLAVPDLIKPALLKRASIRDLESRGEGFYAPCPSWLSRKYEEFQFYWFPGVTSTGQKVLVPAQAVFLFSNLEEPAIFDMAGSSGLGAGLTMAQARLSALLEIVERDAMATTPVNAARCVNIASKEPILQSLLDDYRARGIYPVFQNITTENGIPAWRCMVTGLDGFLAQASAASLSSKGALLSALTETPWPYSWATPAPFGKKSRRPAENLPVTILEELPDFSTGSSEADLALSERILSQLGISAIYCDISRKSFELPVCRAFLPGLETHAELDAVHQPSLRLLARAIN